MKPKTLRFVEQYIDEDPPTGPNEPRYWRGISAYIGDEWVFHIRYNLKVLRSDEPTHFTFETCLGVSGDKFRQKMYGQSRETKEEAKEFAQELFNIYVKSLCDE